MVKLIPFAINISIPITTVATQNAPTSTTTAVRVPIKLVWRKKAVCATARGLARPMLSAHVTARLSPVAAMQIVLDIKNFGRVSAGTDPAPGSRILFVTARLVGAENLPMIARPRLMEYGLLKQVDAWVLELATSMFKNDVTGDVPDSIFKFSKADAVHCFKFASFLAFCGLLRMFATAFEVE